jgi:hypothetical protein
LVAAGIDKSERDKIFYTGGVSIRGMSKKGSVYFKYDTNSTEVIKGI